MPRNININAFGINMVNQEQNIKTEDYVLVVAGANIEYIYKQDTNIRLEVKQGFQEKTIAYGGSGLNYTLKLLAVGIPVFPILPLGNDAEGTTIIEMLEKERKRANLDIFEYDKNKFLHNNIRTVESLIIADNSSRTIWSNDKQYIPNKDFNNIIDTKLKDLENMKDVSNVPKMVMIGHIHSDRQTEDLEHTNLSTKKLIEAYQNRSFLYINLGRSQLSYGFEFWKEDFKKVNVVQFNLSEVRELFNHKKSLNEIIDEFWNLKVTLIITLDKLGALCVPNCNNDKRIIYAPEIDISSEYKDKTGAGDAFASGIVYYMLRCFSQQMNYAAWSEACSYGRAWATYTCTQLGNSDNCPNKTEIEEYRENIAKKDLTIETITPMVVDLIDKAYRKCDERILMS